MGNIQVGYLLPSSGTGNSLIYMEVVGPRTLMFHGCCMYRESEKKSLISTLPVAKRYEINPP